MESDIHLKGAIALKGETIVYVGNSAKALALVGPETQLIDLNGKALLPGFVDPHIHPYDISSPESLNESQQYVLAGGTTTIGDANASPSKVDQFLSVLEFTDLRICTNLYLAYNTKCNGQHPEDWFLEHPRDLAPMLRFAGIKLMGDPAGPKTRCGWAPMSTLLPDWLVDRHEAGPYGDLLLTEKEMTDLFSKYQDLGYQVIVHARGDVTVDTALNAIENALDGGTNVYRHRIEHNDFIRPDQYSR